MVSSEEGTHYCTDGTELYTKTWKVGAAPCLRLSVVCTYLTTGSLPVIPLQRLCSSMASAIIAMHISTFSLPWLRGRSMFMPSTSAAGVVLSREVQIKA